MTWAALPLREPGAVISNIDYQTRPDVGGKSNQWAMFRHRDNRIWEARIDGGTEHQTFEVDEQQYSFLITLSSTGCRPCRFLSRTLESAKRTVSRFANLKLVNYSRLVVDAAGTTEHPRPGAIGVFRMVVQESRQTYGHSGVAQREINGVAYIDGESIVVLPTSNELFMILTGVCHTDTVALVQHGINEISSDGQALGLMQGYNLQPVALPNLTAREVEQTVTNLRDDPMVQIFTDLQGGGYIRPRRNERVVDLD